MTYIRNVWLTGAIVFCFCWISISAQSINSNDWALTTEQTTDFSRTDIDLLPKKYLLFNISIDNFYQRSEKSKSEIQFPNPEGIFETYVIDYTPVVAEEVAHLYTIKTYRGYKKDDPTVLISYDISDNGFHAAVYDGEETFIIEPIEAYRSETHMVYKYLDSTHEVFSCGANENFNLTDKGELDEEDLERSFAPNAKKTFRVGFVTAGEYSTKHGGSPYNATNVLNALASGVNLMNPIFLRDLGIELNLVSNTACIFQNANSDPFFGTNTSLMAIAGAELNSALGAGNYDVGQLISTTFNGGIAYLNSSCGSLKGQSYSGVNNETQLWVNIVSHELGHQFGAQHNFSDECNGFADNDNFRYEPGGGSSVMCYANACGAGSVYANTQLPYFHYRSIASIQNNNGGGNCGTTSNAAANTDDPLANAGSNFTIPKQTPFILVGEASDQNDPIANLTYEWEQYNGNGVATNTSPNCATNNEVLFRHRAPASGLYRHFPIFSEVRNGNNNNVQWEKLPCISRNMNFSFAVRDNNTTFGRVGNDFITLTVSNSGPFDVTVPNGGESVAANSSYTVTWTENGTSSFCPTVDIVFTSNNTGSFSVIADAVPNTGSYTITVPNVPTTNARILVMCDIQGNFRDESTFYDISDAVFTITSAAACPNYLTVSGGPITNGVYSAEITVDSNDILLNSGNVEFYGGTTVELMSGFEAPASTNFVAENQTCL